jgi:hypothetical protein
VADGSLFIGHVGPIELAPYGGFQYPNDEGALARPLGELSYWSCVDQVQMLFFTVSTLIVPPGPCFQA